MYFMKQAEETHCDKKLHDVRPSHASYFCFSVLAAVFSVYCWVTYVAAVGCVPFLSASCFFFFNSLVICLDRRHYNPTRVTAPSSGAAVFVTMALCERICVCV